MKCGALSPYHILSDKLPLFFAKLIEHRMSNEHLGLFRRVMHQNDCDCRNAEMSGKTASGRASSPPPTPTTHRKPSPRSLLLSGILPALVCQGRGHQGEPVMVS